MQIEQISLDRLIPYARNSRTHSAEQVAQIAASIREYGFTNPVLIDAEDTIIAGHGRVLAARKLGLREVPCIRLSHLSEAQKRAYVIADNKLALNAGWNDEMLVAEISALTDDNYDLSTLGFNAAELSALLGNAYDGECDEEPRPELAEKWEVAIECADEAQQVSLLERFKTEGLKCRALTF